MHQTTLIAVTTVSPLALLGLVLLLVRRARSRREHLLTLDPTTGIPNRRALALELERACDAAAGRSEQRLVVSVVALKELKTIRDEFGHEFADSVLVEVYERLRASVPTVTITRLDGDELAGFMATAAPLDLVVTELSARLKQLSPPLDVGGRTVVVHACAGLAVAEPDDDPRHTLRNAGLALRNARGLDDAAVCIFEPAMLEELTNRMNLERDFERALALGEFEVHYQPIVDLDLERPASVEALVRWRHPDRGLLPPAAFIPLAEAGGFIVPLGAWVVGEACRQVQAWRRSHRELATLRVHVNVSPRQLQGRDFVAHVRGILAESGLPPAHLTVEVTESTVADAKVVEQLRALRELGVRIAVDDFGTGYSSLASLDTLPVDTIKIDKRFVDEIDSRKERMTLAAMIMRLARELELRTVAEGVERVEQLESLRALGCAQAQGHLFARPAPARETEQRLLDLQRRVRARLLRRGAGDDRSTVSVSLGPVPAEHARSWIGYARRVLREVDDGLDVSPEALAVVTHYLEAWEHAALEQQVFEWHGIEDSASLWSVLRTWYTIADANDGLAERTGRSVAPTDAVVFEEVLLSGLLRALAHHDLDNDSDLDSDARAARVERPRPTSPGSRRP